MRPSTAASSAPSLRSATLFFLAPSLGTGNCELYSVRSLTRQLRATAGVASHSGSATALSDTSLEPNIDKSRINAEAADPEQRATAELADDGLGGAGAATSLLHEAKSAIAGDDGADDAENEEGDFGELEATEVDLGPADAAQPNAGADDELEELDGEDEFEGGGGDGGELARDSLSPPMPQRTNGQPPPPPQQQGQVNDVEDLELDEFEDVDADAEGGTAAAEDGDGDGVELDHEHVREEREEADAEEEQEQALLENDELVQEAEEEDEDVEEFEDITDSATHNARPDSRGKKPPTPLVQNEPKSVSLLDKVLGTSDGGAPPPPATALGSSGRVVSIDDLIKAGVDDLVPDVVELPALDGILHTFGGGPGRTGLRRPIPGQKSAAELEAEAKAKAAAEKAAKQSDISKGVEVPLDLAECTKLSKIKTTVFLLPGEYTARIKDTFFLKMRTTFFRRFRAISEIHEMLNELKAHYKSKKVLQELPCISAVHWQDPRGAVYESARDG